MGSVLQAFLSVKCCLPRFLLTIAQLTFKIMLWIEGEVAVFNRDKNGFQKIEIETNYIKFKQNN